ncbi:MAG TPA: galactokinase family protein [Candidatus Lokiarchaeia archaeon]|nr:galactokinase family protein [Candidatus Lokiarchaeia archaeon]
MTEIEPGMVSFAPGRICLFGEHQDYLKFPVIAASIDLGIYIEFKGFHEPDDAQIIIEMPDINETRAIDLNIPIPYEGKRDYMASSINGLAREGIVVTKGFTACITGTLPINAGASSSSALVVAWLNLLVHLFSTEPVDPFKRARWANQAEVGEFGEAGGFMDHVTSSVGGILFVRHDFTVEKLPVPKNMFIVLADSEQKKQTVDDLKRLRSSVETQVARVMKIRKGFSITDEKYCNEKFVMDNATSGLKLQLDYPLVYANLQNGIITRKALAAFKSKKPSIKIIGDLVNQHFGYLRDYSHVSTDKIDAMVTAALEAGAVGAKINGSGFGGTMFALCDAEETRDAVAEAIAGAGGKVFPVNISDGAKIMNTSARPTGSY